MKTPEEIKAELELRKNQFEWALRNGYRSEQLQGRIKALKWVLGEEKS